MEDEKYMRRCIELALNGRSRTAPNPMVGAVIVHDGIIIGEGYHVKCGEAHAEVNAIQSVKQPELLKESTIYVSLEPCSHYGKTPPCVDLILEKQIPRIVIGCKDPFAKVSGRGIKKLLDAHRDVKVGILEKECLALNKTFITYHTEKRPYIILKWAESQDEFIDSIRTGGKPTVLSSPLSSMLVHKRRSEVDAIMVGRRTALLDNPSLNVRHWYGKNPLRVVLDRELSLPSDLHLFDGEIETIVFTNKEKADTFHVHYLKIDFNNNPLKQIMQQLYDRGIQSILIEGGAQLLQSLIDAGYWDEAFVEQTSIRLIEGVKAPTISAKYKAERKRIFQSDIIHFRHRKDF